MSDTTFAGSDKQQTLAEQIFQIMTKQAVLFAADAPIRQTLTNLAEYLGSQNNTDPSIMAKEIEEALQANPGVFTREERDDDIIYTTSRQGNYHPSSDAPSHMFKQRLFEPDNPFPVDDISVVVTTTRPALTTVEPVYISDYWQREAGLLPQLPPEGEGDEEGIVQDGDGTGLLETIAPEVVETETVADTEVVEEAAPVSSPSTVMALPNGIQIDLQRTVEDLFAQYENTLTTQLRTAFENDPLRQIVSFGDEVFPESSATNFGKNDMRRIRDYLLEMGEPLLDTQIISDIFYHNPRQNDYASFRFSLNYRLSREKDFEFVGVQKAHLWSTRGLPSIASKRVKAGEMGQITGYIEEGFDESLQEQSAEAIRQSGVLSHILTFFEWEYGILPFTRAMSTLLPSALLSDQRTAVLRFESPQHYTTTLAELRYPTGNRGGWISGFDMFFQEHLVPGALITIARTEEPHVFTVTYEEQEETTERLLVQDEKKNKLAFTDVAYFCAVDNDMLLTQQRYGRLRNLKVLPMNERRKGEMVMEHVFGVIGEPMGTKSEPRYYAILDDLVVALNVLRPASPSYVAELLRSGEYFEADETTPGTWYYTPPPTSTDDSEEDNGYDEYDDEYDM